MARRSIKQRSDGRYEVYYKGKHFYGKTQKEALAKRDAYVRQLELGMKEHSESMTVLSYVSSWLPTYKSGVSDNTYSAYAGIINRLIDAIGSKPIKDTTPDDIMLVFSGMTTLSASYIRKAKFLYTSIFESAVASGYALRNPCRSENIKPPHGTEGTHRAITDEERQLILTTEHRMRTAAMLMLYAGLRRGEVLALSSDDIDLTSNIIHVNKAVRFSGNAPEIVSTKTENGIRDIPIFSVLRPELELMSGLAFEAKNKKGLATEQAFMRGWESYLSALSATAGHPVSIRPHDLRHSFATWLRDCSVDMKICVRWMGHADEKMVMQIYDHITDKRIQMSINQVEQNGCFEPKNALFSADSRQNTRQTDDDALQSLENQRFHAV